MSELKNDELYKLWIAVSCQKLDYFDFKDRFEKLVSDKTLLKGFTPAEIELLKHDISFCVQWTIKSFQNEIDEQKELLKKLEGLK
jgi:hypothetical protein